MEEKLHQSGALMRVLVTGPESTGKSDLVQALSRHFGGIAVPEFAREYITALSGPYGYGDVEKIARHQIASYEKLEHHPGWVFFDTWLIVTKVWFEVVYGKAPEWVHIQLSRASFGLVLLCDTSIPWVPDPVRENGGPMREKLLHLYREELERYRLKWELVTGTGADRINKAIELIEQHRIHGDS